MKIHNSPSRLCLKLVFFILDDDIVWHETEHEDQFHFLPWPTNVIANLTFQPDVNTFPADLPKWISVPNTKYIPENSKSFHLRKTKTHVAFASLFDFTEVLRRDAFCWLSLPIFVICLSCAFAVQINHKSYGEAYWIAIDPSFNVIIALKHSFILETRLNTHSLQIASL